MNVGELNRRIKIWEFVEQRDEFGGIQGSWQVIAQRWGKVEENGGSESSDNNQLKARVKTKIVMRYFPTLNESHRITYGNKIYEINAVTDINSGHYMTIADCTELKDGVQTMESVC